MARSFVNGTDAYIGTSVVNPQPFSIANWVYPTSPTTAGLSFGIGTLTGSHGSAIVGPANPSTANHWTVYLAGSIAADAGVALTLNVWSHCGFTAGTAVGWVAYTNGSQTASGANFATSTTTNPPLVGQQASGGFNYGGYVADCALWNVTLTAAEWAALAAGTRPNMIRANNLVVWYPLDGLVTNEPDLSGNGNNLSINFGSPGVAPIGPPFAPFTRPMRWTQGAILPVATPPILMPQIVT